MKPVRWIGSAYADVKAFPPDARRETGHQLSRVQDGQDPDDFKPIQSIGGGVYEIRVHTQTEHRVFYIARFAEAVYVLRAFEKRTRKTEQRDIALARRRYRQVIEDRARAGA